MNRTLPLFFSLLVLAGCSSVNPQLKAQVDDHLAKFKAADGKSVASPSTVQIADWAAGQYVVVAGVNEGKQSISKFAIESVGPEGIWVVIQTIGYEEKSLSRILFARQPRTQEDMKGAVKKMVMARNDEKPQEYDFEDKSNPMMEMVRGTMESVWSGLVVTPEPEEVVASVSVPAGTFNGCRVYRSTFSMLGVTVTTEGSLHSEVPVNGMVSSRTTDGKSASELLEFGFDGGPQLF